MVNIINLNASPQNNRIVNGVVTQIETRAFQILLLPVYCGGSLLSSFWAVTAAHCTNIYTAAHLSFAVGVQKTFVQSSKNTNKVAILKQHENYNPTTQDNDIALIKSERQVLFDYYVRPITIANKEVPTGSIVVVSGYGYTEEDGGILSDQLISAELTIADYKKCEEVYPYYLTKNMICADGGGGKLRDLCQGDSDGPLTCNNELVGIVSFGTGCAKKGFPGVYKSI